MKLWILTQDKNHNYDTYDSAVVAAETEEEARLIHPSGYKTNWDGTPSSYDSLVAAKDVKVAYLGATDRKISGVVLSSYNAG